MGLFHPTNTPGVPPRRLTSGWWRPLSGFSSASSARPTLPRSEDRCFVRHHTVGGIPEGLSPMCSRAEPERRSSPTFGSFERTIKPVLRNDPHGGSNLTKACSSSLRSGEPDHPAQRRCPGMPEGIQRLGFARRSKEPRDPEGSKDYLEVHDLNRSTPTLYRPSTRLWFRSRRSKLRPLRNLCRS